MDPKSVVVYRAGFGSLVGFGCFVGTILVQVRNMDLGGRAGGGEGNRVIQVVVGPCLASFVGRYRTSTPGVGSRCDQMESNHGG